MYIPKSVIPPYNSLIGNPRQLSLYLYIDAATLGFGYVYFICFTSLPSSDAGNYPAQLKLVDYFDTSNALYP